MFDVDGNFCDGNGKRQPLYPTEFRDIELARLGLDSNSFKRGTIKEQCMSMNELQIGAGNEDNFRLPRKEGQPADKFNGPDCECGCTDGDHAYPDLDGTGRCCSGECPCIEYKPTEQPTLCLECGNDRENPREDSIERLLVCGSSFHEQPVPGIDCHLCGLPTNSFAGDPGEWELEFEYFGGNGQKRSYHRKCVANAIERANRPAEERPASEPQGFEEWWTRYGMSFNFGLGFDCKEVCKATWQAALRGKG